MEKISQLKKKRKILKQKTTKLCSTIQDSLTETDLDQLGVLLETLNDKFDNITTLNNEIQDCLDENSLEEDIDSAEEYREKLIAAKYKLSKRIYELTKLDAANSKLQEHDSSNVEILSNTQPLATSLEHKNVKLPRLIINKFSGDPAQWLEFFNQFENAIQNNPSLSEIDKFSYLKSLLTGSAFNAIAGFALTDANYKSALELLKENYGRKDILINAHMNTLLNLTAVKCSSDIVGLRKLLDKSQIQIRSLQSLGILSENYSSLLTPIILKLIPADIALDFTRQEKSEIWDLDNLLNFLKKEIQSRERTVSVQNENNPLLTQTNKEKNSCERFTPRRYDAKHSHRSQTIKSSAMELINCVENRCLFCNAQHLTEDCLSMSVNEKKEKLRKEGRCFMCLIKNHRIKDCRKKQICNYCKSGRHSTSLCYEKEKNKNNKTVESHKNDEVVSSICSSKLSNSKTYLQTCSVVIRNGEYRKPSRLLLDTGSMRTFIIKDVSRELNLPVIRKETLSVFAFGAKKPVEETFNVVKVKIENRNEPSLKIEIEALETDNISAARFINSSPPHGHKHLKGLQLADCYGQNQNEKITILIGVDYYYNIVSGRIKRLDKQLVASETIFGWCLQGREDNVIDDLLTMKVVVEENLISKQLRQFWELENLGIETETLNPNFYDDEVLKRFESEIKYENKRYTVKLPWKPNLKQKLDDNKEIALRRYDKLNVSFKKNPLLFNKYKGVIDDYLQQNIVEPVMDENDYQSENPIFYLPHKAVIREEKSTSLRIVFDAGSHSNGKMALNDCLHTGPNLYPDIFELIIQFRENPVGFIADIRQAFLRVRLDKDDRDVTRFFFKDNPFSDHYIKLRFTTIIFGINSSPFLLSATIKHHIKKYVDRYPETVELLDSSLYVDDFIGGKQDVEQAFACSAQSIEIFREAGMDLRKWHTNSKELRNRWKEAGILVEDISDSVSQTTLPIKVLGIAWNTEKDVLYFDIQKLTEFISDRTDTKRFLLQTAGRIFDPVGFLGPFTIRIKILIQKIWLIGLDWDEELTDNLKNEWAKWCSEILEINNFTIPRYYFVEAFGGNSNQIELHCFSDASQRAYGTVIYLRIVQDDEHIFTSFVASKSRVAPLKTLSIPRLELMGALLAARLCSKILKSLKSELSVKFWTDSTITYFWIRGSTDRLKPFMKNRVEEIHKLCQPSEWSFCPGTSNPADLVTRGVAAEDLRDSSFWWNGPIWLRQSNKCWPTQDIAAPEEERLEYRKNSDIHQLSCSVTEKQNLIELEKYSDIHKPLRITAWLKRFIAKAKKISDIKGPLTAEELKEAELFWIKNTQKEFYDTEIQILEKKKSIPKSSNIYKLDPFLDDNGILKVGGRLSETDLNCDEKNPIILPRKSEFTKLIIKREHKRVIHGGVSVTLTNIRRKYWIPKGRQTVKKIIKNCLICQKYSAKPATQITSQLPRDRVTESPAFTVCGIDFAGPIFVKNDQKTEKSYIALFTCAVTRALHLELVSGMTTDKFMLAFRRFISRRGNCYIIYSDNFKSFKCANREIEQLRKILQDQNFHDFISKEGITWKYIVERAPWWGGFYERMVKSVKECLKKSLGKALLNFEELSTILTEIEAVVNLRPLTFVYSESKEPEPLTPMHFLNFGRKNHDYPISLAALFHKASNRDSLVKRKLYQAHLLNQLWKKWKDQYLMNLRTAHELETAESKGDIKVGDVVLIEGTSKCKLLWTMGVVKETFSGRDGKVRSCMVGTAKGQTLRRPVQLLYPLELSENNPT